MNRKKLIYLAFATIAAVLCLGVYKVAKPFVKSSLIDVVSDRGYEPVVGFYDRTNSSGLSKLSNPKHLSIELISTALWFNTAQLEKELEQNNDLMITIDTWSGTGLSNVLNETLKGDFDKKIIKLGALLSKGKQQLLVRWNPDMEVPVSQYPWQNQSPELYIKAFNHFAERIKRAAPHIKVVWGPSGYPGDTEYWPGEKNVDAVSITLGSTSEMMSAAQLPANTSADILLKQKLHRMRFINKPVIILGSTKVNVADFNQAWVIDFSKHVENYKTTIYSPNNFYNPTKWKPSGNKLILGVYDPKHKLINEPQINVEHLFTNWGEIQNDEFVKHFDSVTNRGHDVIVTVEPWRDTSKKIDTNVLVNTVKGKYDAVISKMYRIITRTNRTVYLRFAHEMEIPVHRYAWQSQDPVNYINAYRHFMLFGKGQTKNIRRVWGPAGDRGSIDWYPGNDVVDYISIAIYGLPDKNITDHKKQESFGNIFRRKSYRMRFANKPIFITEFGVKGPEDYQTDWLTEAAKTLNANKQVFGACYFNLFDNPKAWGKIKAPDWSITKASLNIFSKALQ